MNIDNADYQFLTFLKTGTLVFLFFCEFIDPYVSKIDHPFCEKNLDLVNGYLLLKRP